MFNNKPAVRTQIDEQQDVWSLATGLACDPKEDLTRQEFKNEVDVNQILARYGVNTPMRQPIYGEVDFDMDLHQAFTAVSAAKRAFDRLPASLKERYPTWQAVLNGLESGQFRIDLNVENLKKETPPDPTKVTPKEDTPVPGVT